jgi:LPS export ABC transporter protein LptC
MGVDARALAQQAASWQGGLMGSKLKSMAAALALALLIAGCEKAPSIQSAGGEEQPSLTFMGFSARGTRLGVLEWEAQAATAQVYSQKRVAHAQQVTIRYFQKGRQVSVAKADSAEIGTESHDILAIGSVVLKARNGVVLETDRLRWDNQRQRVSTDARVKVTRQGSVLTGRGLSADRDLEDVVVRQDVAISAASITDVREQAKDPELRQ